MIAQWFYETVRASPSQADFSEGRIFRSQGFNAGPEAPIEDGPDTPFIILRAGITLPTGMPGSRTVQQQFQAWLHTDGHSMLPIDDMASELELWVPSQTPYKDPIGGLVVFSVRHENTSGDLPDDHYKTNTRYVEFSVWAKVVPPMLAGQ